MAVMLQKDASTKPTPHTIEAQDIVGAMLSELGGLAPLMHLFYLSRDATVGHLVQQIAALPVPLRVRLELFLEEASKPGCRIETDWDRDDRMTLTIHRHSDPQIGDHGRDPTGTVSQNARTDQCAAVS
jgi:hypothetical protein